MTLKVQQMEDDESGGGGGKNRNNRGSLELRGSMNQSGAHLPAIEEKMFPAKRSSKMMVSPISYEKQSPGKKYLKGGSVMPQSHTPSHMAESPPREDANLFHGLSTR